MTQDDGEDPVVQMTGTVLRRSDISSMDTNILVSW